MALPYPSLDLANRVGSLDAASDPFERYEELGRGTRNGIVSQLPPDWTFRGKRILDFGCGAGRTLRQFASEAREADFWGCDIDEPSIRWMEEQMCPPFHVFVNNAEPPLDQPDASFDLIWAVSVFTHLADNWSEWLVELHRILKPGGLLLATFMGQGMSEAIAQETWDESNFGMNVIKYGQSWDLGGPMVIHSPWWIEEHWGRAFEIVALKPDGFASKPWLDHGTVLMRKGAEIPDPRELELIAAGDARETLAMRHNIEELRTECGELRDGIAWLQSKLAESRRRTPELEEQLTDAQRDAAGARHRAAESAERSRASARRVLELEENIAQYNARIFALEESNAQLEPELEQAAHVMRAMTSSVSWRVTAPLRSLKRWVSR